MHCTAVRYSFIYVDSICNNHYKKICYIFEELNGYLLYIMILSDILVMRNA